MRPTDRRRRAVLVAALSVILSHRAAADLIGTVEDREAADRRSDDAIVEANPVLQRLGTENPELLRDALERLRAPASVPSRRRSLAREALEQESEAFRATLDENPDLARYYRESPEAALDLLHLIREAAKTQ